MACVEPALWSFGSKADVHSQCVPRFSPISTLTCRCAVGSKLFQAPLASTGCSWRKRERGFGFGVDRLSFECRVDRKVAERDASVTTSEDERALELVDTDDIEFEEGDDINEMLRQPRSYLDTENWQMFAAEEGARRRDEDGTESDLENRSSVRRRKAEEVLVLPYPGSAAVNWSAVEKEKVEALHAFQHRHEGEMGSFGVEAMRPKHMNDTEELLVDSFAELMGGLLTYRPLLAFTVKQYVRERYATLPHSVTLVGLYVPAEGIPDTEGEPRVAGTVELSFSIAGHPDVPTPAPPPRSPYICNMAIKKEYRRRGLGRQMLKAAEDLALSMGCEDMYLHVRIMDTAPLTMYKEAGYQVVSTDSLLSVLTFQRRRHLMRKRLCRAKLVPE